MRLSETGARPLSTGVLLGLVVFLGCDAELGGGRPEIRRAPDAGVLDAFEPVDARASDTWVLSDTGGDSADVQMSDVVEPERGPCGRGCPENETCLMGSCVCAAGYSADGGVCAAEDGVDPMLHTEAEVCARWDESGGRTEGFTEGDAMCDAGTLSSQSVYEGMRRIQFYRWLTGLAAASTAESHVEAQECALISSWNPTGAGAHRPEPEATCYSREGAAGAGSSNIAWGSRTTVHAIDQWVRDRGNETTMGHRRWILNHPLSGVKLGLYRGGTSFGGAACMGVFGRSGRGRRPDWFALPPPGFSPVRIPSPTWTFHASWRFTDVRVTVIRVSDGANLPLTVLPVRASAGGNYPNATSFRPDGWSRQAGEVYQVTVRDTDHSATYDVRPIDC